MIPIKRIFSRILLYRAIAKSLHGKKSDRQRGGMGVAGGRSVGLDWVMIANLEITRTR